MFTEIHTYIYTYISSYYIILVRLLYIYASNEQAWSATSKSRVAHMNDGDFYSSEKSAIVAQDGKLRIQLKTADGSTMVLRESVPVIKGEDVDA